MFRSVGSDQRFEQNPIRDIEVFSGRRENLSARPSISVPLADENFVGA